MLTNSQKHITAKTRVPINMPKKIQPRGYPALTDKYINELVKDPSTKFKGTMNVTVELEGEEARDAFIRYLARAKKYDSKVSKKWILCGTRIAIHFSEMLFFTIKPGTKAN